MALKLKKINKNLGITLIELIVVIGIFSMVSSVLLFNYSDFSTNVSIRNLSQDIALNVRKAQTYATSVRGINNTGLNTRSFPSYGVAFSLDSSSANFLPNNKRFIIFADIPVSPGQLPSKKYENTSSMCGDPSFGEECLESITINTSDTIVEICTDITGCVSSGEVSITFRRPTPDAIICYKASALENCISSSISYADIVIQSAKGLRKKVSIWNTGQISIK